MTDKEKYRIAFGVACELQLGSVLYGYDSEKAFEQIMEKHGVVSSRLYEEWIFEHLNELRGLKKGKVIK